ncbi:MaoC family protein [Salinarchaeum sp. Harcht-Bsk1]|uniref:CBS domain-containing protein n=1 Tax=Salinarchaeum sp. Harcht-Bsk1 TaxID=1333523 RepID=UPI00034232E3|nr:CBS domain-containing protein [Salinarchaeum sp. Harcht-Bsk1]AGN02445.1 MaoC family protein [Salinarchaeum sp. Harcht-Bsk1]
MLTVSVRDVMVEDVATIRPDGTLHEAADRMAARDVGSLVVVEDDEVVGILTHSDVLRHIASDGDPTSATVAASMGSPPITIEPTADAEDAATLLSTEDVKRLPVVEDGDLVGVVTVTDLSYVLPQIALGRPEGRSRPATRPEMAYDDEEWAADLQTGDDPDVGDTVRFTKRISEGDVEDFARATGDTNRLHLDDGFAIGTRFGERIVHGTLVAGVISAALARLPGLTIYLSQDLGFRAPVPIGATVTAACEITEALGGNRYRVSTTVYHENEPVVDGQATVLIDQLHEAPALGRAAVGADD